MNKFLIIICVFGHFPQTLEMRKVQPLIILLALLFQTSVLIYAGLELSLTLPHYLLIFIFYPVERRSSTTVYSATSGKRRGRKVTLTFDLEIRQFIQQRALGHQLLVDGVLKAHGAGVGT